MDKEAKTAPLRENRHYFFGSKLPPIYVYCIFNVIKSYNNYVSFFDLMQNIY